MKIRVKLFAGLASHWPGASPAVPFEVDLPEGSTMGDLYIRLGLPLEEIKVAFVNGRALPAGSSLRSGDEVGIFPAVGGG